MGCHLSSNACIVAGGKIIEKERVWAFHKSPGYKKLTAQRKPQAIQSTEFSTTARHHRAHHLCGASEGSFQVNPDTHTHTSHDRLLSSKTKDGSASRNYTLPLSFLQAVLEREN